MKQIYCSNYIKKNFNTVKTIVILQNISISNICCSFKPDLSKLGPEGRSPAEFSSNLPQHTCMEVSSMPSKSLISCFRCLIKVGA